MTQDLFVILICPLSILGSQIFQGTDQTGVSGFREPLTGAILNKTTERRPQKRVREGSKFRTKQPAREKQHGCLDGGTEWELNS